MNAAKYNAFAKKVIDHLTANAVYTPPANIKIRAFTVAPTKAGGGTEVVGGGYAPKVVAWDGSFAPAASGAGVSTLAQEIYFGDAVGADWGTIVAIDIRDASTDALLWFATLDAPVTILNGQGFKFRAGDIIWSES